MEKNLQDNQDFDQLYEKKLENYKKFRFNEKRACRVFFKISIRPEKLTTPKSP